MVLDDRPAPPERRAQFLDVAKRLFAERGYQPTTMDEIAKEAGFTKPILYQFFESKSSLYQELVTTTGQQLVERIGAVVSKPKTPREKMLAAFSVYFDMVVHDTAAFRILFTHAHDGETAGELRKIERNMVAFLVPFIDAGIGHDHRRQMAAGIVGMAEGVAIYWLIQQESKGWPAPPSDTAAKLAEHSATLAWGGLRAVLRD